MLPDWQQESDTTRTLELGFNTPVWTQDDTYTHTDTISQAPEFLDSALPGAPTPAPTSDHTTQTGAFIPAVGSTPATPGSAGSAGSAGHAAGFARRTAPAWRLAAAVALFGIAVPVTEKALNPAERDARPAATIALLALRDPSFDAPLLMLRPDGDPSSETTGAGSEGETGNDAT
ncbi:MAG: hypothetical protein KDB19_16590, partial [Microthrixaceae bacterium]|nr:hypothetical protein [Microthrixaceae bacterium]